MTVKFQKIIPAIFLKSKTRLVEAGEHRIYVPEKSFQMQRVFLWYLDRDIAKSQKRIMSPIIQHAVTLTQIYTPSRCHTIRCMSRFTQLCKSQHRKMC